MSDRISFVWRTLAALAAMSLALPACISTSKLGQDLPASGGSGANAGNLAFGGTGGLGGGAGAAGSGGTSCQIAMCQGKVYACGNCVDDDGDGAIDSDDSQCTGPCDDTEDSFFGGIPGQNNAGCRQDCYFDQDTGFGNDRCDWSQTCDPLSVAPGYPPSGDTMCAYDPNANIPGGSGTCASLALVQDPMCASVCLPLTPNGCDCFGCCELPAGSGSFVWLGSEQQGAGSCTEDTLSDPAACHPCTPVRSCFNACDPCEHCVGRPRPDASCSPTSSRCPNGTPCGESGDASCSAGTYCITGCCQVVPK